MDQFAEFVGNHALLSLAFIGLLLALIYNEIHQKTRGFKELTSAGVTSLINGSEAVVIDVSSNNDFNAGHIVNAVHVPLSQVDPESKLLSKFKDRPTVVYCKNGQASPQACAKLAKGGFSDLYMLKGGMLTWLADQLPVTKRK